MPKPVGSSFHGPDCSCNFCRRKYVTGGWTDRTQGTLDTGEEVTFKEGLGYNDGHTLIADGDQSDRAFRREHNHYGPKREGDGRVEDDEDDRGFYTGPGF